jgi:sugar phosphate permease
MDTEKSEVVHIDAGLVVDASKLDSSAQWWTDEEETVVRRKMDWHVVPLITVLYMFCFLDRINIGNARIAGLANEFDLSVGVRFNWALSIFYIIYLLVEVPSNILLKRIGPRFYIPFLVFGFGLITLCMAFVSSFGSLMACRSLLGVFEGGAFPGMAFFFSCFYKRRELLFRIGIYTSAASMAGAFGGLLATGFMQIPEWGAESSRISKWRNIFFFEGILTMIIALLAPIWMPATPGTAWFLDERQKRIAAERLALEHSADPDEYVDWAHVKRAFLCINNYVCALGFFLVNITVQGLSVFLPTILADLGWTATKAQLLTVPPYVVACLVAIAIAYISDKTHRRGIYLAGFALIATTGFAILRWHTDPNIRYMGVFFVTIGAFPGGPGFLAWGINNAAGPAVRAVSSGYIVSLGTIGGIVATYVCRSQKAPSLNPCPRTSRSRAFCTQLTSVKVDLHRHGRSQVPHRPFHQPRRPDRHVLSRHLRHPLLPPREQTAGCW